MKVMHALLFKQDSFSLHAGSIFGNFLLMNIRFSLSGLALILTWMTGILLNISIIRDSSNV